MPKNDRIVLITGAGSGIGRELSIGLSHKGYRTIGIGRNEVSLKETQALSLTDYFNYYCTDLSDLGEIENTLNQISNEIGNIDILINNAAQYPRVSFQDTTMSIWTETINTNLIAPAHLARLVLPIMLKQNYGRIINIGSLAHINPVPETSSYSVSKGGLSVLTRAIHSELSSTGNSQDVTVTEFLPQKTNTSMSEHGAHPNTYVQPILNIIENPNKYRSGGSYSSTREYFPNIGLKKLIIKSLRSNLQSIFPFSK